MTSPKKKKPSKKPTDPAPARKNSAAVPRAGGGAALVCILLFGVGCFVGYRPIWDMDSFWHLAVGRYDNTHGGLDDARDPFSYLPIVRSPDIGFRTIDKFLAYLDGIGGLNLVRAFFAIVTGILYGQAFRLGYRRTRSIGAGVLLTGLVAAFTLDRLQQRPDLLAILFAFLLIGWLDATPRWPHFAKTLVLTLLWTHVHPSAPLALVLAFLACLGDQPQKRFGHVLAAAAALAIYPRGPIFLIDLLRDTAEIAPLVPEFRPLWALGRADFMDDLDFAGAWVRVVVAIFLLAWARPGKGAALSKVGREGPTFGEFARGIIGICAALVSFRFFYMLGFAAIYAVERGGARWAQSTAMRTAGLVFGALLFVFFPFRQMATFEKYAKDSGLTMSSDVFAPRFPVAAAQFLADRKLSGRLFHPPQWGGYLAYTIGDRYKTAHDGRVNVFGPKLAEELLKFNRPEVRAALIERFGIEILIVPRGWIPRTEVVDVTNRESGARRWYVAYSDASTEVLIDTRGEHWDLNRDLLRAGK